MKVIRKKRNTTEVYTASLNDIMFFLLLFFLIISTLVNPSVIKLLLPKAANSEQTVSKQSVNMAITKDLKYYIDDVEYPFERVEPRLKAIARTANETTVVLRADNMLNIQTVVDVIDIGNKLKIKVILATRKN